MTDWFTLNVQVTVALIGGAIVAFGWFVNAWRDRLAAKRARLERVREFQAALAAEIEPFVANLANISLEDHLNEIVDNIRADGDYVPFVPRQNNQEIFRALLPNIHVLPEKIIGPVVQYYSQLNAIEVLVEDLRSEMFAK